MSSYEEQVHSEFVGANIQVFDFINSLFLFLFECIHKSDMSNYDDDDDDDDLWLS